MANNTASTVELPSNLTALSKGWSYAPLASLADPERGISYGIVQPGSHDSDGVPIVRVNDIRNGRISQADPLRVSSTIESKYGRTRLRGGEVLLTLVGTVGESAIVPAEIAGWNVARAVAVIPINGDVSADWVYLCLKSRPIQHLINMWCTTTVQATFNLRDVARLPIPLPPAKIRNEITRILRTFDDKIELNRQTNETMEAMARALFKSWFIDFDLVRAKAAGRKPVNLDSATAALFPKQFASDDDGDLPLEWSRQQIRDVSEINSWTLSRHDSLDVIDYIEISEVMRGNIANIARYDRGEEPSRARRRLRHGDTVLSTVRPDRGAFFLCLGPSESLMASTGFAVVTPTAVPWSVVYSALTQPEVFEHLGHHAHGGAYPAVSPDVIGSYPVTIPNDRRILDAFHRIVAPLLERADHNRSEAQQLAAARDSLLPKLLAGELSP